MHNKTVKIESISKVILEDYIDFHQVNIDLDGRKFGIFVGRKSTELGINVLSGHDFLSVFESEGNIFRDLSLLLKENLEKD